MQTMIENMLEKFKGEIEEFFSQSETSIEQAEDYFVSRVSQVVTELMSAYYEQVDHALLNDRQGRREAGLLVERKGDPRKVLTRLGNVTYRRTYYRRKDGTYCHPVDEIAGIAAYERVSGGVSLALVEAARELSYAKSSQVVTDGAVSRQTVLNKVRQSKARKETVLRRQVPVIHVDADEDHVRLQTGGSTIAPLISGYEGIEKQGKRGICKNIFHISEYGKKPDELWEEFLTELERRYDLEGTRIYLHGDGAPWIRKGLEYAWAAGALIFLADYFFFQKGLGLISTGFLYETAPRFSAGQKVLNLAVLSAAVPFETAFFSAGRNMRRRYGKIQTISFNTLTPSIFGMLILRPHVAVPQSPISVMFSRPVSAPAQWLGAKRR